MVPITSPDFTLQSAPRARRRRDPLEDDERRRALRRAPRRRQFPSERDRRRPADLGGGVEVGAGAQQRERALGREDLEVVERRRPEAGADEPGGELCLLYTSPSPRDQRGSRMPSSA